MTKFFYARTLLIAIIFCLGHSDTSLLSVWDEYTAECYERKCARLLQRIKQEEYLSSKGYVERELDSPGTNVHCPEEPARLQPDFRQKPSRVQNWNRGVKSGDGKIWQPALHCIYKAQPFGYDSLESPSTPAGWLSGKPLCSWRTS